MYVCVCVFLFLLLLLFAAKICILAGVEFRITTRYYDTTEGEGVYKKSAGKAIGRKLL